MKEPLKVLDLFSGIGGFSLGLERTGGFKTVAFCEIEAACQRVLAKHWPGVPIFDDVRTLRYSDIEKHSLVDAICGGFPCQDASVGQTQWGNRVGIDGERTGLWRHIARLAGELRPLTIVLENVPGLLSAGWGRVLGDLAALGYDAEWDCFPASAIGLPHKRERIWAVAYPGGSRLSRHNEGQGVLKSAAAALAKHGDDTAGAWRALDSNLDALRGGDGLSVAMERRRIHALGNAVVPQIPEAIGRAILAAEAA